MRTRETISHPFGCRCSTLDVSRWLVTFAFPLRVVEGLDEEARTTHAFGHCKHGNAFHAGPFRGRRSGGPGHLSRGSRASPDISALCFGTSLQETSDIDSAVAKATKAGLNWFAGQPFQRRPSRNFVSRFSGDALPSTKGLHARSAKLPFQEFRATRRRKSSRIPVGSRWTPWPAHGTTATGVLQVCKHRLAARRLTPLRARQSVLSIRMLGDCKCPYG